MTSTQPTRRTPFHLKLRAAWRYFRSFDKPVPSIIEQRKRAMTAQLKRENTERALVDAVAKAVGQS